MKDEFESGFANVQFANLIYSSSETRVINWFKPGDVACESVYHTCQLIISISDGVISVISSQR